MNRSEIKITIGKDGNVHYEVQGVPGKSCFDFSKFLELGLGNIVEEQKTVEFYQEEVAETVKVTVGDD